MTVDRATIVANQAPFRRIGLARPGLRAASAVVCILLQQDEPCLLITKRAASLRNHSGQWALPGGSQLALHGLTTRVAHFEQPVFAWRWRLLTKPQAEV